MESRRSTTAELSVSRRTATIRLDEPAAPTVSRVMLPTAAARALRPIIPASRQTLSGRRAASESGAPRASQTSGTPGRKFPHDRRCSDNCCPLNRVVATVHPNIECNYRLGFARDTPFLEGVRLGSSAQRRRPGRNARRKTRAEFVDRGPPGATPSPPPGDRGDMMVRSSVGRRVRRSRLSGGHADHAGCRGGFGIP